MLIFYLFASFFSSFSPLVSVIKNKKVAYKTQFCSCYISLFRSTIDSGANIPAFAWGSVKDSSVEGQTVFNTLLSHNLLDFCDITLYYNSYFKDLSVSQMSCFSISNSLQGQIYKQTNKILLFCGGVSLNMQQS